MNVIWNGLISYNESLSQQDVLRKQSELTHDNFIVGQEHPSVITLGRRGSHSDDLTNLISDTQVIQVDRGGQATLHSPGQLVIYPILNLKNLKISPHQLVVSTAKATIDTLVELGMSCYFDENSPGIYTEQGKIAFIGFRIQNGVSYHGVSINNSNDLSLFNQIRSCGVSNPKLDSLNRSYKISCENLFYLWTKKMSQQEVFLKSKS